MFDKWDATIWGTVTSAFFAGLAVAVSLISLYFSVKKPVSDWQRELRSQLRLELHALRTEVYDIRRRRPDHLDRPRHRAKLEQCREILFNAKDALISPRPLYIETIISLIDNAQQSNYSSDATHELDTAISRLLTITNNIDNGSFVATMRHRRRWHLVLRANTFVPVFVRE